MTGLLAASLALACGAAKESHRPATAPGAATVDEGAPVTEEDERSGNPAGCVDRFEPERDYFPDKAGFHHAEQVEVAYHSHYKVVTLREPWRGAERGLRYVLKLCGTPTPSGFEGAEVIEIPARTVMTTSTTEIPHIVGLGLVDRLIGHDELDWVNSPEVRRRIEAGELVEIGSDGRLNVELVVEADPDLLLADSFGDSGRDALGKLREIGVPVALAPSFLETSPLGRAEWIKHTALFFNRERRAEAIFEEVAASYGELVVTVRRTLAREGVEAVRPTVLTSGPIGDAWWVPGGRSYMALLLSDAGADYLWAGEPATGSLPLDLESVFERAHGADFWLQPGAYGSLDALHGADERLAGIAAFEKEQVFNYDARLNELGGNDYWETGSSRPDQVLADLVKIFHPELLPDHELIFHRRLEWSDAGGEGP